MWSTKSRKWLFDIDSSEGTTDWLFTKDGKVIAGISPDVFSMWSASTGKRIVSHRVNSGRCIAISPDGSTIATGGGETTDYLTLWDAGTGKFKRSFVHDCGIVDAAYSPNGKVRAVRIQCSRRGNRMAAPIRLAGSEC